MGSILCVAQYIIFTRFIHNSLYLLILYLYLAPGIAFSLNPWFLLFRITDLYENLKMTRDSLLRKTH